MKKYLFILLAIIPFLAVAQEEDVYNESVTVTGTYRPVIDLQPKINVAPAVPDPDTTLRHQFSYHNNSAHRMTSLFQPSLIKAARVIGEPRTKLYNNYFKLGLGNHWSPYFEAYLHSTTDRNSNYGAYVTHHSHWGNIGNEDDPADYYGPAHASQTDLKLFYNRLQDNRRRWSTSFDYQNDYNLYYGFNDQTLAAIGNPDWVRGKLSTSQYRATYNYLRWNGSVANIDSAALGYHAAAHLGDMFGTYGQNEFHLALDGHADYAFTIAGKYNGRAGLALTYDGIFQRYEADPDHMPLGYGYSSPMPVFYDTLRYGRNLVGINPYGNLLIAGINIHAGLRLNVGNYNYSDSVQCFVFPDVVLSRSFFRDRFGITLGATGKQYADTWNSIRLLNPYMAPGYDLRGPRKTFVFLDLRYTPTSRFEATAEVCYGWLRDLNMYQLDERYALNNVYMPHIEQLQGFEFGLNMAYNYNEMLALTLGGRYYNQHSSVNEPMLFGLTYEAYLGANVNIRDKFLIRLQSHLYSAMDAHYHFQYTEGFLPLEKPLQIVDKQIPVRFGLNLELEYRHTRALSFFARIDNLTWQRYYYFLNYPTQRGVATLGLTYTFPNK